MDLELRRIKNAGTEDEYIVLRVNADCDSGNYLVFDKASNETETSSRKPNHLYIFASHSLNEGDFIWLYTHKEGVYATHKNTSNTTTHKFYWGLGNPICNKDGDKVFVVHFDEWIMKKYESE